VIEQAPPEQDAEPWLVLHTLPQLPQLLVLVPVFVSQPLALFPSQFPKLPVHPTS